MSSQRTCWVLAPRASNRRDSHRSPTARSARLGNTYKMHAKGLESQSSSIWFSSQRHWTGYGWSRAGVGSRGKGTPTANSLRTELTKCPAHWLPPLDAEGPGWRLGTSPLSCPRPLKHPVGTVSPPFDKKRSLEATSFFQIFRTFALLSAQLEPSHHSWLSLNVTSSVRPSRITQSLSLNRLL